MERMRLCPTVLRLFGSPFTLQELTALDFLASAVAAGESQSFALDCGGRTILAIFMVVLVVLVIVVVMIMVIVIRIGGTLLSRVTLCYSLFLLDHGR